VVNGCNSTWPSGSNVITFIGFWFSDEASPFFYRNFPNISSYLNC
jgi:hypothetical protein